MKETGMTQNDTDNKTDENSKANRRAFLRALYGAAPDNLYLELRCIHPATGEVRTLWGRMSSKRQLASILKQADALNDDGYGVYFAPCLRRERKGSADSAAWVSALWIDIDGDETQRLSDMEKLRSRGMAVQSSQKHIRIFLSLPGDVAEERSAALEVIDQLPYDPLLRGKVSFEVIAWDKPGAGTPMLETMPPQEAINLGLPKPSECDIVVVIFWAPMGTPLPHPEYHNLNLG